MRAHFVRRESHWRELLEFQRSARQTSSAEQILEIGVLAFDALTLHAFSADYLIDRFFVMPALLSRSSLALECARQKACAVAGPMSGD